MTVTNEKELGEAIKNGQDYIEVEGDLVKKVFKCKANGKVVWGGNWHNSSWYYCRYFHRR